MANKRQNPKKTVTIKHTLYQIHQLRLRLKTLHEHDIKHTQQHLLKLRKQLSKAQQQKKQYREKKSQISKLLKTKPTEARRNRLQKTEGAYLTVSELTITLRDQIKQTRESLKQHKASLTRHLAEERMLKQFHRNWQKKNPSHQNHHHPSVHATSSITTTNHTILPLSEQFDFMQITHPPAPTDGPDQPQLEADLATLPDEDPEPPLAKKQKPSPYNNYMLDDDFDDDPTQI